MQRVWFCYKVYDKYIHDKVQNCNHLIGKVTENWILVKLSSTKLVIVNDWKYDLHRDISLTLCSLFLTVWGKNFLIIPFQAARLFNPAVKWTD